MKLSTILFGIIAFVAVTLTTLNLVFDMYDADGYNVDLSNDTDTAKLAGLQEQAEDKQTTLIDESELITNGTLGQPGAELESGELTDAELAASSFKALARTPQYVTTFTGFLGIMSSSLGLGQNPVIGMLMLAFIITVALILLGLVFRNVSLT